MKRQSDSRDDKRAYEKCKHICSVTGVAVCNIRNEGGNLCGKYCNMPFAAYWCAVRFCGNAGVDVYFFLLGLDDPAVLHLEFIHFFVTAVVQHYSEKAVFKNPYTVDHHENQNACKINKAYRNRYESIYDLKVLHALSG